MIRLIAVIALAAGLAAPVMAQNTATTTDMEILRQKIKADKKLVVSQNLNLTDAELDRRAREIVPQIVKLLLNGQE